MIISCIGDSLTEGDYGIRGVRGKANVQKENYPYFLAQKLGVKVKNYGKCGYRSTTYLAYYKKDNINVEDSDIIILMLGTNGGQEPNDPDAPENVAYDALVKTLQADAPMSAKLVLCTPPHATENPEYSNCGYAPQVKKAVEFVRAYAAAENLPLIETAKCPAFVAENEHIYQANDGLHFIEAGYIVLADYIGDALKDLFPDMFNK